MLIELKYEVQSGVIGWILDTGGGEAAFSKSGKNLWTFPELCHFVPNSKVLELLQFALGEMLNLKRMIHYFVQKKTQTVDVLQGTGTKLHSRTGDWAGTQHPSELSWREQQQPDIRQVISMLRLIRDALDLIQLSFSSTEITFLVTKTGM